MLKILSISGIDGVNCANNHSGDYGKKGIIDTIKWTSKAGLVSVEVGRNLKEAKEPRFIQVSNTRVAIVGIDTTMPKSVLHKIINY